MFGTSIPFVLIFLYFAIGFKQNKNILIPLTPLLLYSIFIFLFQPFAKSCYLYYLYYSSYFVVFVFGYEIISIKKLFC
jgi:hypothetical protein